MLDTVEIAKKIKSCAKNKGIRLCDMLNDLELGVNAISQLSAGKEMSYVTFAKIADYLGVSVDYLLGIEDQQRNFFLNISEQSVSALTAMLNELSDDDLKKLESYAAFLVAEKEKEPPASSGE